MMEIAIIIVCLLGYLAIVFEHYLHINKTVPALIMATLCWSMITIGALPVFNIDLSLHQLQITSVNSLLLYYLGTTSEILIFLIGSMTIVEIVDMHLGFDSIKSIIKTKNKVKLLWILIFLSFFLSAVIDNLTATIILLAFVRKLVRIKKERLYYIGMIIIATNSGGSWSPIGDVTTSMLWIAGKVTPGQLIEHVFIPSIFSVIIPTFLASFMPIFQGNLSLETPQYCTKQFKSSSWMLYLGLLMIIFVPIFRMVTDLPPYMGMMFSLSIVWMVADYIKPVDPDTHIISNQFSVLSALSRIDLSSILFFFGILLSVGALEALGLLFRLSDWLHKLFDSKQSIVMILGGISSIIDNVPLVAASLGLFSHPVNHGFWHFMAYASGTGGSLLIIGSASGVTAMGIEKIDFFWYIKNISWLAILGYLSGCLYFIWSH